MSTSFKQLHGKLGRWNISCNIVVHILTFLLFSFPDPLISSPVGDFETNEPSAHDHPWPIHVPVLSYRWTTRPLHRTNGSYRTRLLTSPRHGRSHGQWRRKVFWDGGGGQSYLSRDSPINQKKKKCVLVGRYIPTEKIHRDSSRLEQSHSSILSLTAE